MCKICNDRTYHRFIDNEQVDYYICRCAENPDIIEKREGIVVKGVRPNGQLVYDELPETTEVLDERN